MTSIVTDVKESENYITQLKYREYKLNWIIEDFKFVCETIKVVESPRFPSTSTQDGQWYLQLFYKTKSDNENENFKILLKNTSNLEKSIKCKILFKNYLEKGPSEFYSFLDVFDGSFFWDYSSETLFEKLDLNEENVSSVKVYCEVLVYDCVTNVIPKSFNDSLEEDQLLNQIRNSLDDQTLKDVTFKVKGNEFTAHKVILSIRSPVFAAMFKSKMSEELTSIVEIEDIKPAVFQRMLYFIYTDKLSNFKKSATQLYYAAEKYQLEKMKKIIVQSLYTNLTSETVIETLKLVEKFSILHLEEMCLKCLVSNLAKLKDTFAFKEFIKTYPYYSMKIIKMQADEK